MRGRRDCYESSDVRLLERAITESYRTLEPHTRESIELEVSLRRRLSFDLQDERALEMRSSNQSEGSRKDFDYSSPVPRSEFGFQRAIFRLSFRRSDDPVVLYSRHLTYLAVTISSKTGAT